MNKKELTDIEEPKEQKVTNTAFLLMFPALIISGIAAFYAPLYGSVLVLALTAYQFLMLKKFIQDYYRSR